MEFGVDSAAGALRLAERRGARVKQAGGEALPFVDGSFCGVLIVATLCCARDARALMNEAARVLRPGGHLLVGEIPGDSLWGSAYQQKAKAGHEFYRDARFYAVDELLRVLRGAGLVPVGFSSTLLQSQCGAPVAEAPERGLVAGAGFVCLLAQKGEGST